MSDLNARSQREVERLTALNERLSARVDELERRARQDSSTSSRPRSSDDPHKKEKRTTDRSLRERGKRRPGKQPGDPGVTMCLLDDPDESYDCPPAAGRRCGAGLAGEPVTASRRHQVTDIGPPPEPKVTQYVAQAKECPCCGTVTAGELPAHVRARASGAWRNLDGLADFAIVESYLSTAAKWGITKLDALRDLFHGHAWKPPGLESAG